MADKLKVLVDDTNDLRIVMVARSKDVSMISPVVTIKAGTMCRSGNPYAVYGDEVAKFTGVNKYDTSISVFDCVSGCLENFI